MATTERTAAARKRGHGEGTVAQLPNGKWRGRLMVGYKPDGTPDRRSVTGATRQEVVRGLKALQARAEAGMAGSKESDREKLSAFLARWLDARRATLRGRTPAVYEGYLRLHILPELGKHRLVALRPEHVQALYAHKLAAGLAPGTVRKIHQIIHKALADAVRWNIVPRNVADAVDAPAARRLELHPPSATELRRLIEAANAAHDPLAALWAVAAYSGCRQGELLGLQWTDVDLDGGSVTIRRGLVRVRGTVPEFGEPKTARSRRCVTLAGNVVAVLRAHRQAQLAQRLAIGPDYAPYDLVFATHLGTPLMARNVQRSFKLALGRAGLEQSVRFHDLRHAAATMMLQANINPKVVSERLGHSTITLTMDTYSHVIKALDSDAAERLAALLDPAAPTL